MNDAPAPKTPGQRMDQAMRVRSITLAQLSRATGISDGHLSHLRRGTRGGATSGEVLSKIARALGVSVEWLATGEGLGPEQVELPRRLRHRPEWQPLLAKLQEEHPEIDAASIDAAGAVLDDAAVMPAQIDAAFVRDLAAAIGAWRARTERRKQ